MSENGRPTNSRISAAAPKRAHPADAPSAAGEGALSPSDAELIARVAHQRDKAAFARLFGRYGMRVKAFMIKSGASADLAEEAAQEAMLAIWRRAETFDPARASATAWIFAIARNKRVDLLRRGARPEPDANDPTLHPEPEPSAVETISQEDRAAALRAAIDTLPSDQREALTLSFYEGRAHSEISQMLGVPLGTVKSRLRLAFDKLRAALGPKFQDELKNE